MNVCVRNVAVLCVTLSHLPPPLFCPDNNSAPLLSLSLCLSTFLLPFCLFQGTQLIFNAAKELGQLSKLKVQYVSATLTLWARHQCFGLSL